MRQPDWMEKYDPHNYRHRRNSQRALVGVGGIMFTLALIMSVLLYPTPEATVGLVYGVVGIGAAGVGIRKLRRPVLVRHRTCRCEQCLGDGITDMQDEIAIVLGDREVELKP